MEKGRFSAEDCLKLIYSWEILDLVSGKYTVSELKDKKMTSLLRMANDNEKEEAAEWVEKTFEVFGDFLNNITEEEYGIIQRYGGKIGCTSYELNYLLRSEQTFRDNNYSIMLGMDKAISKFTIPEGMTLYRAVKPINDNRANPIERIGSEFTDLGYMSCSLNMEASYAHFEEYSIVWEIQVPQGTNALYVEWFKGSNDESEMLLPRGTTISFDSSRKEIVNGREKMIYTCTVKEKEAGKIR